MKRYHKIFLLIIFFQVSHFTFGQDLWTLETAICLEKFQFRVGGFQSSRVGLTDRIEASTNVLGNAFVPNIGIKKQWFNRGIIIATKHSVYYPKLGLNLAQKTNFRKWIGDTSFIPQAPILKNEVLISRYFKKCKCCPNIYLVTLKVGASMNAFKNDTIFYPIKHSLLYQRTDVINNNYLLNVGLDLQGPIIEWFDFSIDVDYYKVFGTETWAIEHKGLVRFNFSEQFNFFGGYKFAYNPNEGVKKIYFFPLIDAVYKFGFTPKPKNGLFKGRVNRKNM